MNKMLFIKIILIFVGHHESTRNHYKFAHINHNCDIKFEMLWSYLGKSNIEECLHNQSMQKN